MSILINKDTRVITQGITGKTGQFHTRMCVAYANGQELLRRRRQPEEGRRGLRSIPIYASVRDAKAQTGASVSVILRAAAGPPPPSGKRWKPTWTWRSASPKASRFATCSRCATR